jgi:hypothetical protein
LILVNGVGSGFGFHLQPVEFDPEFREEVLVASAPHAGHLLANLADPLVSLLDFRDQALDRFKTGHNFGSQKYGRVFHTLASKVPRDSSCFRQVIENTMNMIRKSG